MAYHFYRRVGRSKPRQSQRFENRYRRRRDAFMRTQCRPRNPIRQSLQQPILTILCHLPRLRAHRPIIHPIPQIIRIRGRREIPSQLDIHNHPLWHQALPIFCPDNALRFEITNDHTVRAAGRGRTHSSILSAKASISPNTVTTVPPNGSASTCSTVSDGWFM